ncbi:DUF5518 domain-containing protein [Halosimplex litoreum]|uniref:DUF5518 domain-containing protein n=1 Tax=Halosimplex litoreum TaxID=1198301 RepID=A0A7U3WAG8_9EURY|nr:DUF5518 domain-containing protein [Halosimplex litoreum]QPV64613.1 DUF5518 domain-containing protein [Halosimplex litoreum]
MASTATNASERGAVRASGEQRVRRVVDWAVPILLGLYGLAVGFGGAALAVAADRDVIAELVAEGTIVSDVFTDAALVDVTFATARWSGVGLVATGLLSWVAAVAFVAHRRRERARTRGSGAAPTYTWTDAAAGGVVTAVTSFLLPFAPMLGGFAGGYLHRNERTSATRVGGLSGLLAVLPLAVALLFVTAGVAIGALRADAVGVALLVVGVVLVSLLFTALFSGGFGALGGYLAGRLRERDTEDLDEFGGDREEGSFDDERHDHDESTAD